MRIPIIAGNWKLNKTIAESIAFVTELEPLIEGVNGVEIVICPVFTALHAHAQRHRPRADCARRSGYVLERVRRLHRRGFRLAFERCGRELRGFWATPSGADVLACPNPTRRQAGAVFCDIAPNRSTKNSSRLWKNGLTPIVCVGETLLERQNGHTDAVVENQIVMALNGIEAAQVARTVFAYEPVWAIGTGETCEADEANRVCGVIRATLSSGFGAEASQAARIQYGGSVKRKTQRSC
jgi:triosephosphate isomerase